jgi:tRNA pseudouridine55 synthase
MRRTRTPDAGERFVNTSGILIVDKPAGWTSFDVVRFLRGRCGEKRTGHAGTLDPAATGVLPVLIGHATRLTEYLMDATKSYEATVQLGLDTDTYDLEGDVLAQSDATSVQLADVEAALTACRGEFLQLPPAYSAIKREGVRLYKMARRGDAVELEPRPVRVHALEVVSYEAPFLRLHVDCEKGFYVRSLAHDIGAALGVGGTLAALVRSRVGPFTLQHSVEIDELRPEFETGAWLERLFAPDEVLLGWQAAILGPDNQQRLRFGQQAVLEPSTSTTEGNDLCRAYSLDGEFLAVMRQAGPGRWQPDKVFLT